MIKRQEADDPNSCWNKARDDERIFILLARDLAAPAAIAAWCAERVRLGKNKPDDDQIKDAMRQAEVMESEGRMRAERERVREALSMNDVFALAIQAYDYAQRHAAVAGPTAARKLFEDTLISDLKASRR